MSERLAIILGLMLWVAGISHLFGYLCGWRAAMRHKKASRPSAAEPMDSSVGNDLGGKALPPSP